MNQFDLFGARSRIALDSRHALTDARTLLGNLGNDPTYGARPLKRVIQRQLVDKLALRMLEGEFTEGDVVRVDAEGGELAFANAAAPAEAASA